MLMDVNFTPVLGAAATPSAASAGFEPAELAHSFATLVDDAIGAQEDAEGAGAEPGNDPPIDWSSLAERWVHRPAVLEGIARELHRAAVDSDPAVTDEAAAAAEDSGTHGGILNSGWLLEQPLPRLPQGAPTGYGFRVVAEREDAFIGGDRMATAPIMSAAAGSQAPLESTPVIANLKLPDGSGAAVVDPMGPEAAEAAANADRPISPGSNEPAGVSGAAPAPGSGRPVVSAQPHRVGADPARPVSIAPSEMADMHRVEATERRELVEDESGPRLGPMLGERREVQAEEKPNPESPLAAEALAWRPAAAGPTMFSSDQASAPLPTAERHDASAKPPVAIPVASVPELRGATAAMTEALAASGQRELPTAEMAERLVQAMRYQFRNGIGDAVVRLKPEHLGAVSVSIRVEHGVVSATVQAEMPAVRQWLEAQESTLRSALGEQGLHLDRFLVQRDPERRQREAAEERHRRRQQPTRHQPDAVAQTFEITV